MFKYWKYFLLSLGVILVDQIIKLTVYYNMTMGAAGQIKIFDDWFKLYYTVNPGMAFGMQMGGDYGKFILTFFRLFAMIAIGIYLYRQAKKGKQSGLLWCIALVLGGAIGNVVDSIFYGIWLGNAPYWASTPWFHGQVIDMFYIDIWEGRVPSGFPVWGGDYISLWPIFNFADASIFVGVVLILIFQKRFFGSKNGVKSV